VTVPLDLDTVERELIALHEACHAVAAMEMGLPVQWVSIDAPSLGSICFVAAVYIPKRVEFPEDAEATAVALAAPSAWPTGDKALDHYARLELDTALILAGSYGIDRVSIIDQSDHIIARLADDILELRNRLVKEGRIEFATASAKGEE
jgi:hypothetical protein